MADATFMDFLKSGKTILTSTMQPRKTPVASVKKGKAAAAPVAGPEDNSPHRIFVRKCISEKPKPKDIVESIKRFIDAAEADL